MMFICLLLVGVVVHIMWEDEDTTPIVLRLSLQALVRALASTLFISLPFLFMVYVCVCVLNSIYAYEKKEVRERATEAKLRKRAKDRT
mmetsp:Transcript_9904/g.13273  ORF Transcript_9904/g.13273 Transcript_9904/m.13273 type:complete len:88 (-) Transcript_9904:261-524(-)